jgi:hypothetical protein
MQLERRQSPRRKLDHLAYINLPAANGGIVLDVSEGGLSFHSVAPVEPAGAVIFRLAVGGIRDIEGIASVAWTDETRKSGGLRFTDLPSEIRTQIQIWLDEADAPPAPRAVPVDQPRAAPTRASEPFVASVAGVQQAEKWAEPQPEPAAAQEIQPRAPDLDGRFDPGIDSSERGSSSSEELPVRPILSFEAAAVETNLPSVAHQNPLSMFPSESGVVHQEVPRRRHGFSIVAAIVLLAFVVTTGTLSYVYRGNAGASLVWLGQRISGRSRAERTSSAPVTTPPSTPAVNGPDSASQAPNLPPPAGSAPSSANSTAPPAGAETSAEKSASAPPQSIPAPAGAEPSTSSPPAHQTVVGQGAASTASQGGAENGAATTNSETAAPDDYGASELALARKYLRDAQGPEDSATAAQLLWVSIEKGNTNAEIELAGLYVRGEGVQKSCEQARVLLTAAANKGNPAAKAKLDELLHAGCS